jgi:conjugative relaxase-like TrwC/TraI family protein
VGQVVVLSIGKVRLAGEGYYLAAVADGVDEYYRGVGEAPGRWTGSAAADLGLDGEVSPEDLAAVWSGQDPGSGEQLGRFVGREIAGFDLTFRPAKSVSLLALLSDAPVAAEVRDAHEAAVDAALAYVEQEAARSRTGHNGVNEIPVNGVIAAAFRHRTSRAGDPHLHSHVLVANMARGDDGRWRTLDGRQLYLHAKTAGYLYEAHLRGELTERLGVEWGPVHNGTAEIGGIPKAVLRHFSDRRRQIEEHLDQTGFRSARAAELAALETRQAKSEPTDERSMSRLWAEKAAEIGWDPIDLRGVPGRVPTLVPELVPTRLFAQLLAPDGLTAQTSTFDRRDVLRALAERAPRGASVEVLERLTDRFLIHPEVVRLRGGPDPARASSIRRADGTVVPTTTEACFSTAELIALETLLVTQAVRRTNSGAGVVPIEGVGNRLYSGTLSVEQAEMVLRLCRSGNGVEIVTAAAGTGKTYTLDAANLIWTYDGQRVIGAAVAGIAARQLQDAAGIPSTTLAWLLIDLDNGDQHLDRRTVIVIDEAGMAGTRTLAPILDAANQAGASRPRRRPPPAPRNRRWRTPRRPRPPDRSDPADREPTATPRMGTPSAR